MATGDKSGAIGKLVRVPVLFGKLQADVDFIVLRNIPFGVVIGCPTIKRLEDILDFPAEVV